MDKPITMGKDLLASFFAVLTFADIHTLASIVSVALVCIFTIPGIIIRWRQVFKIWRGERIEKRDEDTH